ncbi:DNA-binding protein [Marinitoga sp. 1135]|uniref:Putative nucleic-acid-binding protein (Contains the HHH domain) n=1 Tax=Marinitoga piezophila (strain DSM 14283 / JCM 11233 / KA3) TaxID=443254 RepID=H2J5I5_MARPK|nr:MULTISPECIES: DNA integrity scanning diadenylate cyclase DisA [Marinitoga]AEX86129.1 putative nucleic-acid-binding protein (contains the HHH domain) [Marinitoga piezophila KA3]APT76544.1 DNA-binding protein [Marinitoga sp. 1137]NUU96313.1 DNA-binding protein [Marinitoga sp. 1135]NUU98231.1 DNA-binding protein [Marinitoga sp. 1138]
MTPKNDITDILSLLAPGKKLRDGIDLIISANLGALIFLTDNAEEHLSKGLIQLGFVIDTEFEPERMYELAKMDGAIVLNKDATKILYANAQLNPSSNIPSFQTGMRHRTAERMAKQTDEILIAVSKRRNQVSIYYGTNSRVLYPETIILPRLNQEIAVAQRYKQSFFELLSEINIAEMENRVILSTVVEAISKGFMTLKVAQKAEKYLLELGEAAESSKLEINEIYRITPRYLGALIMDYSKDLLDFQYPQEALKLFDGFKTEEFLNMKLISQKLGYDIETENDLEEFFVTPRGFRLLYSTRIPSIIVRNVVETFKNLETLMKANMDELINVPGIGKKRAERINRAIRRKNEFSEKLSSEMEDHK